MDEQKFAELSNHYLEGKVYVWGAKLERQHQIEKMIPNHSLVLFRRGKRVFRIGVITDLLVDIPLAEYLWGQDSDGAPWAIIYLMNNVRDVSIDASEINKIIGRKPLDNWQGMISVANKPAEEVVTYVRQYLAEQP